MKKFLSIVFLLIMISFSACGGDAVQRENSATFTKDAVGVSEGSVVDWVVTKDSVTIPATDPLLPTLSVGSILVGGSENKQLLRRIVAVFPQDNETRFVTEDIALTDAFEELYISFSQAEKVDVLERTDVVNSIGTRTLSDNPLWMQEIQLLLGDASNAVISLTGTFKYDVTIEGEIEISWGELKKASMAVTGGYDVLLEAQLQAEASFQKTYEQEIGKEIVIARAKMPVGPIFIWIDVMGELKGGVDLSLLASLEAKVGSHTQGDLKVGVQYKENGWNPLYKTNLSTERVGPTLNVYGEMIVRPYLKPELSFEILSVAGPALIVEGFGKLKGSVSSDIVDATVLLELFAGITANAGGKVDVFGYEKSLSFEIFNKEEKIWSKEYVIGETGSDSCLDGSDHPPFPRTHAGLNWSCPEQNNKNWNDAKSYCTGLGGRLPTISELRTLIKDCSATVTGGACTATDACSGFSCLNAVCEGCAQNDTGKYNVFNDPLAFWTSIPVEGNPQFAWLIGFNSAGIGFGETTMEIPVICVSN